MSKCMCNDTKTPENHNLTSSNAKFKKVVKDRVRDFMLIVIGACVGIFILNVIRLLVSYVS